MTGRSRNGYKLAQWERVRHVVRARRPVAYTGGSMGGVLDLFNVLYDPAAVFARVKEKPRFWGPFVGLAVLQLAITALMIPYTRALMEAMVQARGGTGAAPSWAAYVGIITGPIFLAISLVLSAGVLWILASILAGEASFRHLLSVTAYVGITGLLMTVASLAVLKLSGGRVQTAADLRPGLGLDLLAPGATGFLKTLLWMVNPFTLWGLVLTGLGVAGTHNTSKGSAFTVATIAFLINALIAAAFSMLGGGAG
jgi:hypothetical protein